VLYGRGIRSFEDKQVASSETKVFVKSAVIVGLIGILKKKIKNPNFKSIVKRSVLYSIGTVEGDILTTSPGPAL